MNNCNCQNRFVFLVLKRGIFFIFILFIYLFIYSGCNRNGDRSDGYGNFESTEVIVSAEANGKIEKLALVEGSQIAEGQIVGYIDTLQLQLKRLQLQAAMAAVKAKMQNVQSQIDVLIQRKSNLVREQKRLEILLKGEAATQKQYDDVTGEIAAIDKQIIATQTQLQTVNSGILSEIKPLEIQIAQVGDMIAKSYIKSPIAGTVLTKYAEQGELTTFGKPLFKIANTKEMFLRVYISGTQLPEIKINQKVSVFIDKTASQNQELSGTVSWISEKAEFTPKIIQTKEERVNLVYAVKILVINDGRIKIGMPGEIRLK